MSKPENIGREKRIILIGKTSAGKTTLCQRLNNEDLRYKKTQTVQIINQSMIDTPGEYLEQRKLRGALMVTSTEADVVVFVQDATENGTMFPPYYGSSFAGKPIIGIVTKCDLASQEQIEIAKRYLTVAGAARVYVISNLTGFGIDDVVKFLQE